jgi:formylglycine-generating enzyme
VKVHLLFREGDQHYLPMERLFGRSLSQACEAARRPFTIERAVEIVREAAEAVGYAHAQDPPVLHRDLKPGNVFVTEEGAVKVLDFGLARTLGDRSLTAAGLAVGTPAYLAPEVLLPGDAEQVRATAAADVYALGLVLYRLLAGRLPFDVPEGEEVSPFALGIAVIDAHRAGLPRVAKEGLIDWVSLPGGTFMMGSDRGHSDERPVHEVTISPFEMARSETTVAQYRACVRADECEAPGEGGYCNWGHGDRDDHPVNCVDWGQAKAFCEWRGGQLPSESQWEYAARSGGKDIPYPWGPEAPSCERAVFDDGKTTGPAGKTTDGCGQGRTWPVCKKQDGNSAQRLCDLAGNVWEWVEDCWHKTYAGAPSDGSAWIANCGSPARVVRGGSWGLPSSLLRAAYRGRYSSVFRYFGVGFRCVRARPGTKNF